MRFVSSDVQTAAAAAMAVAVALSMIAPSPVAAGAASKTTSAWSRPEPDPPRKKDMKTEKLDRLIGSDYNEMWMSKTARITVNRSARVHATTTSVLNTRAVRVYLFIVWRKKKITTQFA